MNLRLRLPLLMTLAVVLVVPAISQDFYPPDIQRIIDREKLVVAVYHNDIYPLFYHDSDNRLTGHEIELARKIAEALNVDVEFNRNAESFDGVIELVETGRVDLGISLISRTPRRAMRVRFSDPYLIIHPVLIVNRVLTSKMSDAKLLEDLNSAALPVSEKTGTSYIEIAAALFPDSEMIIEEDWNDVILNVVNRDAGIAIRDEIGVKNYTTENRDQLVNLRLIILDKVNDYIGIAIHPDNLHLESWVNIFLEQNSYPIGAVELFDTYGK